MISVQAYNSRMTKTIFLSAGEASGEHYGALLCRSLGERLRQAHQPFRFIGMGGERMVAEGLERIVKAEDMAVMGLTEVVRHLPKIYREFRRLKQAIRKERPALAILIDFPEIHLRLAEEFKRLGIPVLYFVSPQLWAWKKHRIKQVQRDVKRMAVIFPFEEPFYRNHGVEAEFVGHPLADLPHPSMSRAAFAQENGLEADRTWIALLPGSRPREIRDHLPEILEAAWKLTLPCSEQQAYPCEEFEFLIPLAPTLNEAQRAAVLATVEACAGGLNVHLVEDARAALHHARASVVASGTATVEAALIGNPFVVIYRVSRLTYAMAKRMVKVDHVAMANLIAEKRAVPELLQAEFTAARIVEELNRILPEGEARATMLADLVEVGRRLGAHRQAQPGSIPQAIERVAAIALEELGVGDVA